MAHNTNGREADLRLYCVTRAQGLAGVLHGAVGYNGNWVTGKDGKPKYVFGNDDGKDWHPFRYAWPADTDAAVAYMLAEADKGDVYTAAELMHADQLTVSSAVEMRSAHADRDDTLDLDLVRAIGAYAIGSGSPGHGHVFADFDTRFFAVDQYRELCRKLGDYLGGCDPKIVPNDMLRPAGTYNRKFTKPKPVVWLVKPGPPIPLASVFGPFKMDPVAFWSIGTGTTKTGSTAGNPAAESFDLDAHPRVKTAIGKRSGDLSDDIYGVVAECFDAQLTPGNARFAIDSDPVLAARLGRGDIPRIWTKLQAKAAATAQSQPWKIAHSPNAPLEVAELFNKVEIACGRQLGYWRGQWFTYGQTHWGGHDVDGINARLYRYLQHADYDKKTAQGFDRVPWNPDESKLRRVVHALRAITLVGSAVQPPAWLDGRDEPVIACRNGLLRIADRTLINHTDGYFNLFSLPFDYDAAATCPRWTLFLEEILPGDVEAQEALQEWFGYVLSGRTDLHKMLALIGATRSGKGTIDTVLTALVGAQAHIGMSAHDLQGQFGLQGLIGKSLAVFSDDRVSMDRKRLVEILLSVSGEDDITINIKYGQPHIGRLPVRLMFLSNEPPSLPDSSSAIVGRLLMLNLPTSFLGREDPYLPGSVLAELPGILCWALDGLDRLNTRGKFIQPASGAQLIELVEAAASPVKQFVETECVLTGQIAKAELYGNWALWCQRNGHTAGSSATLGVKLFAAYNKAIRTTYPLDAAGTRQIPTYKGISMRPGYSRSAVWW